MARFELNFLEESVEATITNWLKKLETKLKPTKLNLKLLIKADCQVKFRTVVNCSGKDDLVQVIKL
jgi:hypothetical protein